MFYLFSFMFLQYVASGFYAMEVTRKANKVKVVQNL